MENSAAILIMAASRLTDRQECLSYCGKSAIPGRLDGHRAAIVRIAENSVDREEREWQSFYSVRKDISSKVTVSADDLAKAMTGK